MSPACSWNSIVLSRSRVRQSSRGIAASPMNAFISTCGKIKSRAACFTSSSGQRASGTEKEAQQKIEGDVSPDGVGIAERPAVVEERIRVGDLEIDTVIGKNHQGAIVTTRDRASGMLKMIKVPSRDSKILTKETIRALQDWKPYLKTMTSDNGKEFALHRTISDKLNLDFYFAEPYHSWERGSNENLNGLIRQYFPKKTDFSTITKTQIKYVELKLNNRPRKRFGFQTPNDLFNQLIKNQEAALVA